MKYFVTTVIALILLITVKAQYSNPVNQGKFATTQQGMLNGASVFTVEFWVKTIERRSSDTYWQRPYLFGNETNGSNSGDLGITTNNGYIGMWEGISTLNADQQFLSTGTRINDDLWHHIAAVNNGQTINLYVDGNIVGSLVSGRQLITASAPLTFGAATLDHGFPGNTQGSINFISQAQFGEARISNIIRYTSNFNPSQALAQDMNALAVYHFDDQGYSTQAVDPNQPASFDPSQAINDNAAQPATLFLKDSITLTGRLLLGKKDWSLSNEIYIRFFEGNSKKVQYFKPEDVKGFQMGDSYYEPKFLGAGGAISTSLRKTMVKRLTPKEAKMAMYEYDNVTGAKTPSGFTEYKTTRLYFVQLPNTTDDRIYQFNDNKFTPHFDSRVSALLADKPELAEKIKSKNKEYFYQQISQDTKQYNVWWNIINEYNK